MPEHKNKSRARLKPLNLPTLALSVGGLGFLRPAPGTWGSIPPCAVAFLMVIAGAPVMSQYLAMGVLLVLSSAACVVWGRYAEQRFGRKDAAEVVADETAGCAIVVAGACFFLGPNPGDALTLQRFVEAFVIISWAFILFRVMDILKPPPGRWLENAPHGWGVLLDDLLAGVYALALMILSMLALGALGIR